METRILVPSQFKIEINDIRLDSEGNSSCRKASEKVVRSSRKKTVPRKRETSTSGDKRSFDSESSGSSSSPEDSEDEKAGGNDEEVDRTVMETEEEPTSETSEKEELSDSTWTPSKYCPVQSKSKVKAKSRYSRPIRVNKTRGVGFSGDDKEGLENSVVKILAAVKIESGTEVSHASGDYTTVFLKDQGFSIQENVRFAFGCFDQTVTLPSKIYGNSDGDESTTEEAHTESESTKHTSDSRPSDRQRKASSKLVRQTNWVRFVRQAVAITESGVNFIGKIADGKVRFEASKDVQTGEEIVVYFDIDSLRQNLHECQQESFKSKLNQAAPLDLSGTFPSLPRSPSSNQPSLDLMSPVERKHGIESLLRSAETNPLGSRLTYPFSINDVLAASSHPSLYSSSFFKPPFLLSKAEAETQLKEFHAAAGFTQAQGPLFLPPFMKNSLPKLNPHASLHHLLRAQSHGKPGESSRSILRNRGRERSLLPCEVCGKTFDRPSLLKRHMRTHTGEKPHICDVCSKGFSTSSSLNTHRRIHSGEKPHQCPICGKRFTASSNLYYHRMTHNKEKPHKCVLCAKSFPTPGDLKSHQYVHSGSWPYNCPVCHRGFSKQTNLRNHLLLHSGDKPHNCQICGKKFALACNLRAHLRTHEEDSTSSCVSCNRSFLTNLNMLDSKGRCQACILQAQDQHQRNHLRSMPSFRSLASSSPSDSFKPNTASSEAGSNSLFPSVFLPPVSLASVNTSPSSSSSSNQSCFLTMESHNNSDSKKVTLSYANPSNNRRQSTVSHYKPSGSKNLTIGAKPQLPRSPVADEAGPVASAPHGLLSANSMVPPQLLHFLNSSPFAGSSLSESMLGEGVGVGASPVRHEALLQFPFSQYLPAEYAPPTMSASTSEKRNPLIEQWLKWQWLLANETPGNLTGLHKKLMESQMLASQIMSVSMKGSQTHADMLNLR